MSAMLRQVNAAEGDPFRELGLTWSRWHKEGGQTSRCMSLAAKSVIEANRSGMCTGESVRNGHKGPPCMALSTGRGRSIAPHFAHQLSGTGGQSMAPAGTTKPESPANSTLADTGWDSPGPKH
jgi:hypothetical protein